MITADLLARHDRPGPRYTSYPTAVDFTTDFGPSDHARSLAEAATDTEPLSLYMHLPFCAARCWFCACHVVVSRNPAVRDGYLQRLLREIPLVAAHLGTRRGLGELHWGGGTPTSYDPSDLRLLHRAITAEFELLPESSSSVEVDPRVTTLEHLETLADLGFERLSMGVQDLDPTVQRMIGRDQTADQTIGLYQQARRLGFRSVSIDLVHGLPGQDLRTMGRTLDLVLQMRPDRLAVYPFAHVPWMRPHQRRLDESKIPDTAERLELLALVRNTLTGAGYRAIGMDHFALPDDALAVADELGTLGRTFMGYTSDGPSDVIALGTSGISDIGGSYAQNHRRLASYLEAVESRVLPIERGYRLSADDLVRREVIKSIMCRWGVDLDAVAAGHGLDGSSYFAEELAVLTAADGLVADGLVRVSGGRVDLTADGRPFVRRLAQVFDAHTTRRTRSGPTFSTAI